MSVLVAMRRWHRPLVLNSLTMAVLVMVSLVGLLVDPRTLVGQSVWVKPLKFALSFGLYAATLAWLLTKLTKGRRTGWWLGTVFAISGVVDVAVVVLAAASGTFSHFNARDDLLNAVVQTTFQYGVPALLVANLVIGVVVLFQGTVDRPLFTAIRWGLWLSTAGMVVAFVLIGPGGGEEAPVMDANGESMVFNAGHSIGTDTSNGAGMPFTGWNTAGGDLRVPHFVGLHGLHVLLGVAILLGAAARRPLLRDEAVRTHLTRSVAVAYTGLFAVTVWQAARGQSVIDPDAATIVATFAVLAVPGTAAVVTLRRAASRDTTAVLESAQR